MVLKDTMSNINNFKSLCEQKLIRSTPQKGAREKHTEKVQKQRKDI